jgi:hypothetical protein
MPNIVEWSAPHLETTEKFAYPTLRILVSENGRPIQYGFVHGVAVIEGIAPNPGVSDLALVSGLKALVDQIVEMARSCGVKEVLAMTGKDDGKLERLAERYGFEEVPYKVWRLKI